MGVLGFACVGLGRVGQSISVGSIAVWWAGRACGGCVHACVESACDNFWHETKDLISSQTTVLSHSLGPFHLARTPEMYARVLSA